MSSNNSTPVLVLRWDAIEHRNGIGSIYLSIGRMNTQGSDSIDPRLDYWSDYSEHKELNHLKFRCQWNTKKDELTSTLFDCYAIRAGYTDETDLSNFECRAKTLKKIQKYLEKVPSTKDFGQYVYNVCKALKIDTFVRVESSGYDVMITATNDIKDAPMHINHVIDVSNDPYKKMLLTV